MTLAPSPLVLIPPVVTAPWAPPKPPRVWPVYVNMAIAISAILGLAIALVIVIILIWAMQHGGIKPASPEYNAFIKDLITNPEFLLLSACLSQVATLGATLIPAWLSPEKVRFRLQLQKPAGHPLLLTWIAFAGVSVGIIFDCAIMFMEAHHIALPTQHLEDLDKSISNASGLTSVLVFASIVLGAPILEELLCRGYMQSRLVRRHGPVLAILICSAYFGLLHMDLLHSTFAFFFGLYLGIAAWRTGSTFTSIGVHLVNNLISMLGSVFAWQLALSPYIRLAIGLALLASGLVAMRFIRPPPARSTPPAGSDGTGFPAYMPTSTTV